MVTPALFKRREHKDSELLFDGLADCDNVLFRFPYDVPAHRFVTFCHLLHDTPFRGCQLIGQVAGVGVHSEEFFFKNTIECNSYKLAAVAVARIRDLLGLPAGFLRLFVE